jgi:hypothetical protein
MALEQAWVPGTGRCVQVGQIGTYLVLGGRYVVGAGSRRGHGVFAWKER